MKTNVNINGQTVEITLTEEQVKQLSAAVKPKNKRWRADDGGSYWAVIASGVFKYFESLEGYHGEFYAQGNYFRTEEEAQAELTRRIKKQAILDRIAELNDGWVPDWSLGNSEVKYIVEKIHSDGAVKYRSAFYTVTQHQPTNQILKSAELAGQIIKEFGEDLKYLFE